MTRELFWAGATPTGSILSPSYVRNEYFWAKNQSDEASETTMSCERHKALPFPPITTQRDAHFCDTNAQFHSTSPHAKKSGTNEVLLARIHLHLDLARQHCTATQANLTAGDPRKTLSQKDLRNMTDCRTMSDQRRPWQSFEPAQ